MLDNLFFSLLDNIFFSLTVFLINVVIGFAISQRLGYSAIVGFLMFVPIVNVFVFLMLAFRESPNEKELRRLRRTGGRSDAIAEKSATQEYFRGLEESGGVEDGPNFDNL